MQVLARASAGPTAAAAFVDAELRALDPDVPLLPVSTVDEALARRLWPQRLFGSMFAIFASIAMLLATCGLYAVTSYAVSAARARSACVSRSAPTHARCGGPSRARHFVNSVSES